jgi:hypothetical protein
MSNADRGTPALRIRNAKIATICDPARCGRSSHNGRTTCASNSSKASGSLRTKASAPSANTVRAKLHQGTELI